MREAIPAEEPGNQLAGYDMRVRSPWKALPVAFYTQWIGEDEAGGLPSKFIGQFGLEFWGASPLGGYRLRAEYADTACVFNSGAPEFNCAYRHHLYPQGYAYRGRIIGHSLDNDSQMFSVAGLLTRTNGDVLSVALRRAKLNRDGGGTHAISDVPARPRQCRIALLEGLRHGQSQHRAWDTTIGARRRIRASDVRGSLSWQQGF